MSNLTVLPDPVNAVPSEPVSRGFGLLRCPKCSEAASIQMDLDNMDVLTCRSCEDEFSLADVREMIDQAQRWQRVLAFIDTAPVAEGEG